MSFLPIVVTLLLFDSLAHTCRAQELKVDPAFRDQFDERLILEQDGLVDLALSPNFDGQSDFMLLAAKEGELYVLTEYQSDSPSPPTLALDISRRICFNGERGLLSVAIHPEFSTSKPWIYLYYTHLQDECYSGTSNEHGKTTRGTFNRLSRFVLDPDTLTIDEGTEEMLLETIISPVHNHCGGDIDFGKDGLLYAVIGDHYARQYQNDDGIFLSMANDNLAGKIVRLTEDGGIPDDNPHSARGVRCGYNRGWSTKASIPCLEIYASGLRNPFRFAMNPNTQETKFFINVVGWKNWEWIVEGKRGAEYGYPVQDGPCQNVGTARDPMYKCGETKYTKDMLHFYPHDAEYSAAITSGAFVPDEAGWPKELSGSYLFGDYRRAGIYRIVATNERCMDCDTPVSAYSGSEMILSATKRPVSMKFGLYNGGYALYYLKHIKNLKRDGTPGLFRISYASEQKLNVPPKAVVEANPSIGFSPLSVQFIGSKSEDPDGGSLTYSYDFGDGSASELLSRAITFHKYKDPGLYFARLTVTDEGGASDTVTIPIEVDDNNPIANIESPELGASLVAGKPILLQGSAIDKEDGVLLDSSLVWDVFIREELRPSGGGSGDVVFLSLLESAQGNNIEVELPVSSDLKGAVSCDVIVRLTATDSAGIYMPTSRSYNLDI